MRGRPRPAVYRYAVGFISTFQGSLNQVPAIDSTPHDCIRGRSGLLSCLPYGYTVGRLFSTFVEYDSCMARTRTYSSATTTPLLISPTSTSSTSIVGNRARRTGSYCEKEGGVVYSLSSQFSSRRATSNNVKKRSTYLTFLSRSLLATSNFENGVTWPFFDGFSHRAISTNARGGN